MKLGDNEDKKAWKSDQAGTKAEFLSRLKIMTILRKRLTSWSLIND